MPICYLFTNLKREDISDDLEDKLQECISEMWKKPNEKIHILINTDLRMKFAGKKQAGLVCQIHAINVFDKEKNAAYFPPLFERLSQGTKLPNTSIAIEFVDLQQHMVKTGL